MKIIATEPQRYGISGAASAASRMFGVPASRRRRGVRRIDTSGLSPAIFKKASPDIIIGENLVDPCQCEYEEHRRLSLRKCFSWSRFHICDGKRQNLMTASSGLASAMPPSIMSSSLSACWLVASALARIAPCHGCAFRGFSLESDGLQALR